MNDPLRDLLETLRHELKDLFRRVAQLEMAGGRSFTGGGGSIAHAPVTLGGGSDPALALTGQQLTLANVLTPTEHTAIGNGAPHHAAVTLNAGSDPALALVGQELNLTLPAPGIAAVIEGPGIDVVGNDTVGIGGDSILLYDSGGSPCAEYVATDAGLTAALAAMTAGDTVELPSVTIVGGPWTIAHGTLCAKSLATVLSGQVNLSDGTHLENCCVHRDESSASDIYGIVVPDAGCVAYVRGCNVYVNNSGAGMGIGVLAFCRGTLGTGTDDPGLVDCTVYGSSYDVL